MIVSVPPRTIDRAAADGRAQVADAGLRGTAGDALRRGHRDRAHVDQRRPRPRSGEDTVLAQHDVLEGGVVGEHRDADVGLARAPRRGGSAASRRARRAARPSRACGSRPRARSRRRGSAPRSAGPCSRGRATRYCSSHPPSTSRLTPFTAPFSSRNTDAPTISSVVTGRPIGVRARDRLEHLRLVGPLGRVADDAGMDRVDADRRELHGEGAHEPFDAAVDGRDRRRARVRPPQRQAAEEEDRARPASRRGASAWTTSVYPTSFRVTSRIARAMS